MFKFFIETETLDEAADAKAQALSNGATLVYGVAVTDAGLYYVSVLADAAPDARWQLSGSDQLWKEYLSACLDFEEAGGAWETLQSAYDTERIRAREETGIDDYPPHSEAWHAAKAAYYAAEKAVEAAQRAWEAQSAAERALLSQPDPIMDAAMAERYAQRNHSSARSGDIDFSEDEEYADSPGRDGYAQKEQIVADFFMIGAGYANDYENSEDAWEHAISNDSRVIAALAQGADREAAADEFGAGFVAALDDREAAADEFGAGFVAALDEEYDEDETEPEYPAEAVRCAIAISTESSPDMRAEHFHEVCEVCGNHIARVLGGEGDLSEMGEYFRAIEIAVANAKKVLRFGP